jgi:hypothetical protein
VRSSFVLAGYGAVVKWTTAKPTVPGWYWYRRHPWKGKQPKVYVLEFIDSYNGLTNSKFGLMRFLPGQWSGPLVPPEEP